MWNLAVEFKQILCYVFMSFNRFEDTGFKVIQVFLLNEFLIVHDPLTFFFTAFFFSPTCPLSLSLPSFPTFKKQRATLFSFHFSSSFFLFACTRSAEISSFGVQKMAHICLSLGEKSQKWKTHQKIQVQYSQAAGAGGERGRNCQTVLLVYQLHLYQDEASKFIFCYHPVALIFN